MKRYILRMLVVILFAHFIISGNVFAGTIPPMPGLDCGNPASSSSSGLNKCCYVDPNDEFPFYKDSGFLGAASRFVYGFVNAPLRGLRDTKRKIQVPACVSGAVPTTPGDTSDPNCTCVRQTQAPLVALEKLCEDIGEKGKSSGERSNCLNCVRGTDGNVGVWTGLGCFYADLPTLIQKTILGWGIGFAGVLALLCMIYSTILLQTSRANPEKIKKAQELLVSCITGLLLIIFSIFILRLIGVDILRIPGFS